MPRIDFRDAALGDNSAVFTEAFADVNLRLLLNREAAVNDYGALLRSLEYSSRHCETVTPLAVQTYGNFMEVFENTGGQDCDFRPTEALGHLLSYGRHHYNERNAVFEAALESLPRYAAMATRWNTGNCVSAATMVMDNVAILHERAAFGKLFDTLFEAASVLKAEFDDTAHSVIFRAAGVADRAYVQDLFKERAEAALVEMRTVNPSSASLLQRAVEFLQPRMHMSGLNNDLV